MAKTFTIVNDLSANIASGFGIEKAHVKSYTKTTKDGNQVQVKEHEDRRQHKVAVTEQKARIKKVSDMLFQRGHYSSRVSNSEMIKLRAEFKELKASIEKQDPDAMKTFNRFGNFEGR